MRRVARGNRIVSINKVIFPISIFRHMKKNERQNHFFLFKFDRCHVFDDDFFTYSELAKTRTSQNNCTTPILDESILI